MKSILTSVLLVLIIGSCSKNEMCQQRELNISYTPIEKSEITPDTAIVEGVIETYEEPAITIYPNPTSGIISCHIGGSHLSSIQISNDKGDFKKFDLNDSDFQIDLGEEKDGVYCCEAVIGGVVFRTFILKI